MHFWLPRVSFLTQYTWSTARRASVRCTNPTETYIRVRAHIMDQGTVKVRKQLPYVAGTLDTGLFVQNKTKTNQKTVFPDTSKVPGYEILH